MGSEEKVDVDFRVWELGGRGVVPWSRLHKREMWATCGPYRVGKVTDSPAAAKCTNAGIIVTNAGIIVEERRFSAA